MSEWITALILAIIQGITEWLPISSSGHLVLFEHILRYDNGGLAFEVALHFGTLMAVFVYFGKEITDIIRDFVLLKWDSENGRLGVLLIIASIPAGAVGFFVVKYFDSVLSNLTLVGLGFGITGLLLFIASLDFRHKIDDFKSMPYGKSFLVGIAQAVAIAPGISRSGATISSGLLLGLNEKNAMKFSFLMAIPVIFGANLVSFGNQTLPAELIWASFVSFIVGLLSIHIIFKYVLVTKKNLRWFAAYCIILSISVLIWILA